MTGMMLRRGKERGRGEVEVVGMVVEVDERMLVRCDELGMGRSEPRLRVRCVSFIFFELPP